MLKLLENLTDLDPKLQKAPVSYEEVRVSGFGRWFLLRLSLHDTVLPPNIEAPSHGDAVKLGLAAVKEFPALDSSALDKVVQYYCMATFDLRAFSYFIIFDFLKIFF